jgi:hypothetical protein
MITTEDLLSKVEDAISGKPNTCSSEHTKTLEAVRAYLCNDIAVAAALGVSTQDGEARQVPTAAPAAPSSPSLRVEVRIRLVKEDRGLEQEYEKHTFDGYLPDDWTVNEGQDEYEEVYYAIKRILEQ